VSGAPDLGRERENDRAARLMAQTVFDRPLLLEAGAGTGKTATLVARLVSWCVGAGWERAERDQPPVPSPGAREADADAELLAARVLDGVVAITFTEAAAAEMATRVAEALAEIGAGGVPRGFEATALAPRPEVRQARAAALLAALDHLVVCTIHAFCRRLLARYPLEAGVHPAFTVDAEGLGLEQVVREVVEEGLRSSFAGGESDILFLAAQGLGPQELAAALAALAAAPVPASVLAEDPFAGGAAAALCGTLLAAAEAFESVAASALRAVPAGSSVTHETLAAITASVTAVRSRTGEDLASFDELCATLRELWPVNLRKRLRLWSETEFNRGESAALGEAAAAVAAASLAVVRGFGGLWDLKPLLLDHARRALAPLLAAVQAELRAGGVETFGALLRDARDLLASHPEVAARERRQISQLLVDEFQDTDRLQCRIIRDLALGAAAGPRPGLFLVGDPKQSIYGWRNADLGAYEEFVGELRAAGGEVARLAVNHRSAPPILAEVTRCIGGVMAEERGVQPGFEPLVPAAERAAGEGFRRARWAAVEMWVSWQREGGEGAAPATTLAGDAAEVEAQGIARDIRDLHEEAGVPWQEVGVLLRSTGDLPVYLDALRDAGVPYTVERDRAYYSRREIIEAAALVRTVLDPGDHLALVAWLRSATVGVPDAALLALWRGGFPDLMTELAGRDEPSLQRARRLAGEVAAALPHEVPGIDRVAGWEHALVAGVELIAGLREDAKELPANDLIERLRTASLIEAGEAARYGGHYRLANLDLFFRRLLTVVEEAAGDPQAALRVLRASFAEAREAEEGRPREAVAEAVRVMTVHRAKGLDFTHVYLAQMHKGSGRDRPVDGEVEEVDGRFEYRLLGAPTPGFWRAAERRARVRDAELVRTLYVAMTRAKERLVMAGNWPAPEGRRSPGGSHLGLLLERPHPDFAALFAELAVRQESCADEEGARWVFPALLPPAAGGAPAAEPPALPGVKEVWADSTTLAAQRRAAASRMGRPFTAPASRDAHAAWRAWRAEERFAATEVAPAERFVAPRGSPRAPDSAATAAGSAVHRVLEMIALDGTLAAEVAQERGRLDAYLDDALDGAGRRDALARANEVLDRLLGSPLAARLAEVAPHVLARELPLVLPAEEGEDAAVGYVGGAVDMIYRDPADGTLVVADYKTDRFESDEQLADLARRYALQGRVYCLALQGALRLAQIPRFELWFLDAGRVEVPDLADE
jgi:ATP-dependent exoDNAse (exonuclease V) beta subunit